MHPIGMSLERSVTLFTKHDLVTVIILMRFENRKICKALRSKNGYSAGLKRNVTVYVVKFHAIIQIELHFTNFCK